MSDAHDARLQGCRIIKDLRNLGARERGVTGSPDARLLHYKRFTQSILPVNL